MDANRFDALLRSLTNARSRRTTARSLVGLALAGPLDLLGPAESDARKKRKKSKKPCGSCRRCKKGKCKPKPDGTACGTRKVCRGGSCVAVPPTCSDEIRNGDETDVDCGGSCPSKCANGRDCADNGDCQSGHCVRGICRECETAADCPSPNHPCREAACIGGACQVVFVAGGGQTCNTGLPGVCAAGTTRCENGVELCDQNVQSSAEVCDGLDNDCDGEVDEGACPLGQRCESGGCCKVDGFGAEHACTSGTECCSGNCATHFSGRTCRPAGCLPLGADCTAGAQVCCSFTCSANKCQ